MRLYANDVPDSNKNVSIHASVKDATLYSNPYQIQKPVSIHASVKDATCWSYYGYSYSYGFNPRICKRCDASTGSNGAQETSFNPRICKRCDGASI